MRESTGKHGAGRSWIQAEPRQDGVSRLRAELVGEGHCLHAHDTYALSVTDWGIQESTYRGAVHRSVPGQVLVLHPDEPHDGRGGDGAGFGYRTLYLDPAAVHDAAKALAGATAALPFVRDPVVRDAAMWRGICGCFHGEMDPLRSEAIIVSLTRRLLLAGGGRRFRKDTKLASAALDRAAEFLRENAHRTVLSPEVESHSGLSRFELDVQFRRRYGTTPYRYLLLRRLEIARERLLQGVAAADAAAESGFADQSHMTRAMRRAYGFTPARLARLHRAAGAP